MPKMIKLMAVGGPHHGEFIEYDTRVIDVYVKTVYSEAETLPSQLLDKRPVGDDIHLYQLAALESRGSEDGKEIGCYFLISSDLKEDDDVIQMLKESLFEAFVKEELKRQYHEFKGEKKEYHGLN